MSFHRDLNGQVYETGADNQAFCYDEQNRLVWASAATGTPPCGGTLTGGTLTSAQYTASYAYDNLGRLTSAPLGGYTYGDANHLDAATSVGSSYTASYDAAGDMTCRAPSGSVTCAGTPTGSVMTYDNERRLATWQNTPSNPTSTAAYWYDGEGQRVAQTLNGVTTYYIGSDEEITGSTLLKYYHIPGLPVLGTITGVTRTYLASDGLGSETVDLSYNGTVLATALYGPYGVGRYATGTMPTSKGYTGQRQDSGSGLDYYGARYYDAVAGQFTSADSVQGPNRYAYVGGNPETATDPSGTSIVDDYGGGADVYLHWPNPRYNARDEFNWVTDDGAGSGGHWHVSRKKPKNGWSANELIEIDDGKALTKYFQMHVDMIGSDTGPTGTLPTADYDVYARQSYAALPDLWGDLQTSKTRVELYTPKAGSLWDDPSVNARHARGIVQEIIDKGDAQASIIVVDLRNVDPGNTMSTADLNMYAGRAVFTPYSEEKSSKVARVIYVLNGEVIDDYDPLKYGPPGDPNPGRRVLLA